ncbi:unnamed protein product [Amoebophrya sp. A120]|nr:unnamed protein product [Amoebophrya sp. A120]|eukprot:GSA120T00008682001.1
MAVPVAAAASTGAPSCNNISQLLQQLGSDRIIERDRAVLQLSRQAADRNGEMVFAALIDHLGQKLTKLGSRNKTSTQTPESSSSATTTTSAEVVPLVPWGEKVGLLNCVTEVVKKLDDQTRAKAASNQVSNSNATNVATGNTGSTAQSMLNQTLLEKQHFLQHLASCHFLKDSELRVRRALVPVLEAVYERAEFESAKLGHETFFQAVLSDVLFGFERKKFVGLPKTTSSSKEKMINSSAGGPPPLSNSTPNYSLTAPSTRAALAPAHLKNSNFGLLNSAMNNNTLLSDPMDLDDEDFFIAEEVEPVKKDPLKVDIQPPQAPHESEGWGTLESSMACLAAILRGLAKNKEKEKFLRIDSLSLHTESVSQVKPQDKHTCPMVIKLLAADFFASSGVGENGGGDVDFDFVKPFAVEEMEKIRALAVEEEREIKAEQRQTQTETPLLNSMTNKDSESSSSTTAAEEEITVGGYNDLQYRQGSKPTKTTTEFVLQMVRTGGGATSSGIPSIQSFLVQCESSPAGNNINTTSKPPEPVIQQVPFSVEYFLLQCVEHSNRFVREYAFLCFADLIPLLSDLRTSLAQAVTYGLQDNWSQVKYAASKAVRAMMEHKLFVQYQNAVRREDAENLQLPPAMRSSCTSAPDSSTQQQDMKNKIKSHIKLFAPFMCLNRHYVAEGVRLYSQENWKILNPFGGIPLILEVLDEITDAYCDSTNAPNHAVREAACKCILELADRVAVDVRNKKHFLEKFTSPVLVASQSAPDFRKENFQFMLGEGRGTAAAVGGGIKKPDHATGAGGSTGTSSVSTTSPTKTSTSLQVFRRIDMLILAVLSSLEDESWPVRDHACLAAAKLASAFPEEMRPHLDRLLKLLIFAIGDNINCLRKNAGEALAIVLCLYEKVDEIFTGDLRTLTTLNDSMNHGFEPEKEQDRYKFPGLDTFLKNGEDQPMDSKNFAQYTPSGPFSVPLRRREYKLDDKDGLGKLEKDPRFDDATMYSCGSVAPRNFKKFRDKGGCMNCTVHGVLQPWEQAEGAFHCLIDIAKIKLKEDWCTTASTVDSMNFSSENRLTRSQEEFLEEFFKPRMKIVLHLYELSHFPHHCQLKQTICERLVELVEWYKIDEKFLVEKVKPAAFEQTAHKALAVAAAYYLQKCGIFATPKGRGGQERERVRRIEA